MDDKQYVKIGICEFDTLVKFNSKLEYYPPGYMYVLTEEYNKAKELQKKNIKE